MLREVTILSMRYRLLAATASVAFLAGCMAGPDYEPVEASQLGVPQDWSVAAPESLSPPPEELVDWWRQFEDPILTRLIERAILGNTDLDVALARLRQAREALVVSRSALYPSVSGTAGYNRVEPLRGGGTAITQPDGTVVIAGGDGVDSFSLGLDASYQLDLFGGNRRAVQAGRAELEASGFDYASTLRAVESEVARNYILARAFQAQLANALASVAIQDENLQIAGWRVMAGLVSAVDEEQARASRAQSAATIPQIRQQYNAAVTRIAVLTGQAPGAIRPLLEEPAPIPQGPERLGADIPADVLRRRPDVRAAERQLAAATARIGVAKAQLYPNLAISGRVNTNAPDLSSLLDAITGNLFAGLTQSIFAGGRLAAQARSAEAAADGAFASYRGTVLTALEDVENAIVALQSAEERETQFTIARDAALNSAIYARSQYRTGLTDFTTLNVQETALLSARNGLVQARADRANALVALFDALGGGWNPAGDYRDPLIISPLYGEPTEGQN